MTKLVAAALMIAGCAACAACALACGKSTRSEASGRRRVVAAASPACLSALPARPRSGDDRNTARFVPVDGTAPAPRIGDEKVSLSITAPASVRAATPLGLGVAWDNRTTAPLSLVHAVHDGSYRRSEAEYALYARDQATGRTYLFVDETTTMCGTLNTFADADHHALAAGGHFDAAPYTRTGRDQRKAAIDRPGRYTVWLAYRFCGYSAVGGETSDVTKADVFTGVAVSNAVDVEIVN